MVADDSAAVVDRHVVYVLQSRESIVADIGDTAGRVVQLALDPDLVDTVAVRIPGRRPLRGEIRHGAGAADMQPALGIHPPVDVPVEPAPSHQELGGRVDGRVVAADMDLGPFLLRGGVFYQVHSADLIKGVVLNGLQGGGELYPIQGGAFPEGALADGGHALGEGDHRKLRAVRAEVLRNNTDGSREGQAHQVGAVAEDALAQDADAVRELHAVHARLREGVVVYGDQALRQHQILALKSHALESPDLNDLQAGREVQGLQPGAVLEGRRADAGDAVGQLRGPGPLQAEEGGAAHGSDAVQHPDAGDHLLIVEPGLALCRFEFRHGAVAADGQDTVGTVRPGEPVGEAGAGGKHMEHGGQQRFVAGFADGNGLPLGEASVVPHVGDGAAVIEVVVAQQGQAVGQADDLQALTVVKDRAQHSC